LNVGWGDDAAAAAAGACVAGVCKLSVKVLGAGFWWVVLGLRLICVFGFVLRLVSKEVLGMQKASGELLGGLWG